MLKMTTSRRTRDNRAMEHWTQDIRVLNITITRLEGENSGWWGVAANKVVLNGKIRKLIKQFYLHCLDYVVLATYEQLFNYGKNCCFEDDSLQSLLTFLKSMPAFPSRHEWLQNDRIQCLLKDSAHL